MESSKSGDMQQDESLCLLNFCLWFLSNLYSIIHEWHVFPRKWCPTFSNPLSKYTELNPIQFIAIAWEWSVIWALLFDTDCVRKTRFPSQEGAWTTQSLCFFLFPDQQMNNSGTAPGYHPKQHCSGMDGPPPCWWGISRVITTAPLCGCIQTGLVLMRIGWISAVFIAPFSCVAVVSP